MKHQKNAELKTEPVSGANFNSAKNAVRRLLSGKSVKHHPKNNSHEE